MLTRREKWVIGIQVIGNRVTERSSFTGPPLYYQITDYPNTDYLITEYLIPDYLSPFVQPFSSYLVF
jgi:hypothetical protein